MSGQFPVSPVPKTVDVESEQYAFVGTSNTGRRHARKLGGHLWRLALKFPPMFIDTFAPIWGFQMENDASETFLYQYPLDNRGVGLTTETTAKVNAPGGVAAGATSFAIDGLGINTVDKFKIGDFFTVSSSAKVHQITRNSDTDALGNTVVTFRPETIDNFADNDAVVVNKPSFSVAFINTIQKFNTSNPKKYRYEAELEESL